MSVFAMMTDLPCVLSHLFMLCYYKDLRVNSVACFTGYSNTCVFDSQGLYSSQGSEGSFSEGLDLVVVER